MPPQSRGLSESGVGPIRWAPTRAFGRAVLLVGVCMFVAIFLRRPDVVVLAAPVAIGAAIGLWHRPSTTPEVRLNVIETALPENARVRATIDVANHDELRYDLVVARLVAHPWLGLREADRPYATGIAAGDNVGIDIVGRTLRWGRHPMGPVVAHAVAADALLISPPATAPASNVTVYPFVESFTADDAMPRAAGTTGFHRSRRPGEGGELAGVRPFGPGDRLRRIDWRVSTRTRELHVSSTLSDRDAQVVVLLDVLHEAGLSAGIDGPKSVLDTTVHAAAGIGDHYMHRGDRVAYIEYGLQARRLRAGAGHRNYLTALEWLLDVAPSIGGAEPPPTLLDAHAISANALLVVLTPMIDPKSSAMLARLARSGRFMVAVDTLPPALLAAFDGRPTDPAVRAVAPWLANGEFTSVAARLWRLDRANTIGQLREHGVPVVTWAGSGSLDDVLQQVTRASARVVRG